MKHTSICRFMPAKHHGGIKTIRFVYETEFPKMKQPFVSPVYTLYLVATGSASLTQHSYRAELGVGDLYVSFPACPAELKGSEDFTYLYINFMGSGAEELLASLDIRSDEPVYRGLAHLLPFWHGAIGRINQQNANILTESVLLHTLSYLTGKTDGITQKESHENLLSAITDYIHTHFRDSDLSLCKIADIFSYTEKYISFFFKKHMKIGFNSYLNSLRIKYSLELMEKNARSVGYIARECGYEDALYFSKVFKKTMACTPTEYMKKVGALPTGDPYMNLLNDLFEDH